MALYPVSLNSSATDCVSTIYRLTTVVSMSVQSLPREEWSRNPTISPYKVRFSFLVMNLTPIHHTSEQKFPNITGVFFTVLLYVL